MSVGVGNEGNHSLALGLAQLFVVNEEEQLVFFDRSAEAAAELVLAEGGDAGSIEEIAGVQSAIAQELVRRSVKGVRAGLARRIHHRAVAAELRAVGVGQQG